MMIMGLVWLVFAIIILFVSEDRLPFWSGLIIANLNFVNAAGGTI